MVRTPQLNACKGARNAYSDLRRHGTRSRRCGVLHIDHILTCSISRGQGSDICRAICSSVTAPIRKARRRSHTLASLFFLPARGFGPAPLFLSEQGSIPRSGQLLHFDLCREDFALKGLDDLTCDLPHDCFYRIFHRLRWRIGRRLVVKTGPIQEHRLVSRGGNCPIKMRAAFAIPHNPNNIKPGQFAFGLPQDYLAPPLGNRQGVENDRISARGAGVDKPGSRPIAGCLNGYAFNMHQAARRSRRGHTDAPIQRVHD